MPLTTTPMLVYLIAAGLTLLMGILMGFGYYAFFKGNTTQKAYDNQLNDLINYDEFDDDPTKKTARVGLLQKWNGYWADRFRDMGWARYNGENSTAGRDVFLVALFAGVIITLLVHNPIVGVLIPAACVYVLSVWIQSQAHKKAEEINIQLPGFISAMKSNVQANETTERALLKVVDNMPSPLYDDLAIAKNLLLANSTFEEAIEEMGRQTSSRDLKFLCACLIQASQSGANMEAQLGIIKNVLDARRAVTAEIDRAVRSQTPAIWVATFVIPGSFIASYFMDANAKDFWFSGAISWIALGAVVLLYALGVWMAKTLVDGIRRL